MTFTILHVSDVHFGMNDDFSEQDRITDALVAAVRRSGWVPDLCIFSGDLAFSGKLDQFQRGAQWLNSLLASFPDCRLFIVPGNHDVDRTAFAHLLDRAGDDKETYAKFREFLEEGPAHLSSFRDWHEDFAGASARLVSDWNAPFGCHARIDTEETKIHIVGLNTALLSKGDGDKGELIQDIKSLNGALSKRTTDKEMTIAVGHHPLDWLATWNGERIREILAQKSGAHLYLHGHLHEQSAIARSSATGASMTTLECGAAYAGGSYPMFFSFYQIDFAARQIDSRTYLYGTGSGEWIVTNERSQPIVANIPQIRPAADEVRRKPVRSRAPKAAENEAPRVPAASPGNLELNGPGEEPGDLEDAINRRLAQATIAHRELSTLFSRNVFWLKTAHSDKDRETFSQSERVKSYRSAIDKIRRMREAGKSYGPRDITDICGFRFVTRYQSDVPLLVGDLLRCVAEEEGVSGRIRVSARDGITIHTSRRDDDPLSIVEAVRRIITEANPRLKHEIRSRQTGYSSVHVGLQVDIARGGQTPEWIDAEVQIRSVLEEVWGQLDHGLRYGEKRGAVGSARWLLHLNVLKAHFDACAQHLDLIKEIAVSEAGNPAIPARSSTITRPEQVLASARGFLPAALFSSLEAAFQTWKLADASRQRGGNQGLFHKAADEFADLLSRDQGALLSPEDRASFRYIVLMEQAFMLTSSGDVDDLAQAEGIYQDLLRDRPDDAACLFRLGQALRLLGRQDMAISQLDRAIGIASQGDTFELYGGELAFILDHARIARANCLFRKFEQPGDSQDKLVLIRQALEQALDVVRYHKSDAIGVWAVNDALYYGWEERHLLGASRRSESIVIDRDFDGMLERLAKTQLRSPWHSYEFDDTLARAHLSVGNRHEAAAAAHRVCTWLEQAAAARCGRVLGQGVRRLSHQWEREIEKFLRSNDEQDALAFALDVIATPVEDRADD